MATLQISDFSGGLNTEFNPINVAENEATILENFIVEYGKLKRRKGFALKTSLPSIAIACYPFGQGRWLVVLDTLDVYVYDRITDTLNRIGSITASVTPKFAYFDPYVCIASGGSLYLYDTNTGTLTQTSSPPAVDVLVKDGRVWICGGDEVWASRVGDPTDWTNVSGDDASAQFMQIGYKDGGEIKAFALLYDDIIVFKDTGVFRIQGKLPSVSVSIVSKERSALSNRSVLSIKTDIVAIDKRGAYLVSSSFKYGDIVFDSVDVKVKNFLLENFDGYITLLIPIRAIAFKLKDGWLLYFYQSKAWAVWRSGINLMLLSGDGEVILGLEQSIFEYTGDSDTYSPAIWDTQNVEIANAQDPIYQNKPMYAIYKSKQIVTDRAFVIKRFGISVYQHNPTEKAVISLTLGKAHHSFTFEPSSPEIWDMKDVEIASAQTEIYSAQTKLTQHKHRLHRTESFSFYLTTGSDITIHALFCDISQGGN